MRSLLRSLLVWLMVLALPLQGLAGTAMQHGATAPQQSAHRSTAEAARSDHPPFHAHVAAVQGHTHGQAADPAGAVVEAPTSAPAVDGEHHCSACAACCSALGLPSWAEPLAAPTSASAAPPLPPVAVDSFLPAGLDRPPRSGLG